MFSFSENFEAALSCAEEILSRVSMSLPQLSKLVNSEDRFKQTALHIAASLGNAELMSLLLKFKAKVTCSSANESIFYFIAKLGKCNMTII